MVNAQRSKIKRNPTEGKRPNLTAMTRQTKDIQGELSILSWNVHDSMAKKKAQNLKTKTLSRSSRSHLFSVSKKLSENSTCRIINALTVTEQAPGQAEFVSESIALLPIRSSLFLQGAPTFKHSQSHLTLTMSTQGLQSSMCMTRLSTHPIKPQLTQTVV